MASVDVGVALLGYGTVGAAVNRLLAESGEEIERATGHRLRVVRALVRDARQGAVVPGRRRRADDGLRGDPRRPVDRRRRRGDGRARAGRRLRARAAARGQARRVREQAARRPRGAELFATASEAGVQLRFEASRVRGDPRDQGAARVARRDERAPRARDRQRDDELHPLADGARRLLRGRARDAQELGYAEADPTDDVEGVDAAAKMAILATVAFGSRVDARRRRRTSGIDRITPRTSRRRASSGWSCGSSAPPRSSTGRSTCACSRLSSTASTRSPRSTARSTPSCSRATRSARSRSKAPAPAASRPRPRSSPTSSASSAPTGTGFLQNDAAGASSAAPRRRRWRSPFYVHLDVADRPGVLAHAASGSPRTRSRSPSSSQHLEDGDARARRSSCTTAPRGPRRRALAEIASAPRGARASLPVALGDLGCAVERYATSRWARATRRCCTAPRLSERSASTSG